MRGVPDCAAGFNEQKKKECSTGLEREAAREQPLLPLLLSPLLPLLLRGIGIEEGQACCRGFSHLDLYIQHFDLPV
jgi:hypothetical protein